MPTTPLPAPPRHRRKALTSASRWGLAFHYEARVYEDARKGADAVGYVRRGQRLRVGRRMRGSGCKGGQWYAVHGGAICTAQGFVVSRDQRRWPGSWPAPRRDRPLSFRYGLLTEVVPIFYRLPEAREREEVKRARAKGQALPDVVERLAEGDNLIAINRLERGRDGAPYFRTIRGRYIPTRGPTRGDKLLEPFAKVEMRGEVLGDGRGLPLAFVVAPQVDVRCEPNGPRCAIAKRHARFFLHQGAASGSGWLRTVDDRWLAREGVQVARRMKRPDDFDDDTRWIHVDRSAQTLVAYEGQRPVFATLVSTGKRGFETPAGRFRVYAKHLTVEMTGAVPNEGPYVVEEVPWAMYYWESFALHGAYWHDDFGQVKSHGCTNLAPADARWLFFWSTPRLPPRWHGVYGADSTWVVITP